MTDPERREDEPAAVVEAEPAAAAPEPTREADRRQFLAKLGLAAGVAYVAPILLRVDEEAEAAGSKKKTKTKKKTKGRKVAPPRRKKKRKGRGKH